MWTLYLGHNLGESWSPKMCQSIAQGGRRCPSSAPTTSPRWAKKWPPAGAEKLRAQRRQHRLAVDRARAARRYARMKAERARRASAARPAPLPPPPVVDQAHLDAVRRAPSPEAAAAL